MSIKTIKDSLTALIRFMPSIDGMAVAVLSLEWCFFGSLHFVFRKLTEIQIPEFIPFKTPIVGVTGMIEVATGILICLPKTRKPAALMSLILLTLFLPAIHHMLVDDTAIPDGILWRTIWRLLLVPNHVLLALCAIRFLPSSSRLGPVDSCERFFARLQTQMLAAETLIVAGVMLLANVAGFAAILGSAWDHGIASIWALMCLATGALIGFLFGVPKFNKKKTNDTTLLPNPNIVEVSDWLTKIMVGVGLTQFRSIGEFIGDLAILLGNAVRVPSNVHSAAEAQAFALALIVYFFADGIIQGYLFTRMFLTPAFEKCQPGIKPALHPETGVG